MSEYPYGWLSLLPPLVAIVLAIAARRVMTSMLAGAIFGDHCSPISDTTVLSSQASGCNHMAHVQTQLPYALLVASISVLFGTLPIGLGVSVWIMLPIGVVVMLAFLLIFGKCSSLEN